MAKVSKPEVSEETLTLEQLEARVRGRIRTVGRWGMPTISRLTAAELAQYEAAKLRGWALLAWEPGRRHRPLESAWEEFCRLAGRAHAYVRPAPWVEYGDVSVRISGTWQVLPRPGRRRVGAFLLPWAREGEAPFLDPFGVTARLRSLDAACEIIAPLIDMVLEEAVPPASWTEW
jgi:hypothetical protein